MRDEFGIVTRYSSDGGIDGIIKKDKLRFNKIYIQVKQWNKNTKISRPVIQKFVGALQNQNATK